MKSRLNKSNVDKIRPVPVDLRELNDVIAKEVVKKDVYDELGKKVNAIDISKLVNKTDYNAKIKRIENKVPSITHSATTSAFTAFKKKIPNVSNLVRK